MDWTTIITTILTAVVGLATGGTIMFYKANKSKAETGADGAKISVVDQALATVQTLQQVMQSTVTNYEATIMQKNEKINATEDVVFEMRSKMKEYDYKFEDHERKINGLQEQYTIERSKKRLAEGYACVNLDCDIRKPMLGEFKSDND